MKKILNKNLLIGIVSMIICGFLVAAALLIVNSQAEKAAKNLLALRLIDSAEVLRNAKTDMAIILSTYEQGALAKCRALAYVLENNNGKINNKQLLDELSRKWDIEEYHISNGAGIVELSNNEQVVGYDMSSAKQSQEFLPALTQPDFEYIQLPSPRGIDGKLFQYIGVSRRDTAGIVQIGYHPKYYQDIYSVGSVERRMQSMRVGEQGYILAVRNHKIIAAEDASIFGHSLSELGIKQLPDEGDFFSVTLHNIQYLACYESFGDIQLIGVLPKSEVFAHTKEYLIFLSVVVFSGLFVLILYKPWK